MSRNITLWLGAALLLGISLGVSVSGFALETAIPVTLVCSEVVNQVPSLYFSDAAYQSFAVELSGEVPGEVFTGELVVTSIMAEGYGTFMLEADTLVDLAGNTGSVITSGGTLYVERPQEFPTATWTPSDSPTPGPTGTPMPTATPTPEPQLVQRSNTWPDGDQLLFSVPLDVEPADAAAVFEPVLGPHDRLYWRVLTYSPQLRRYLEYGVDPNFPEIGPGRGFWLVLREAQSLSVTLNGYELFQSREMTIPLKKGFNQFGSSFFYPVPFDALLFEYEGERLGIVEAAAAGWVANQLWYLDADLKRHRYDVAGFGSIQNIEPWVGYWIWAKEDLTLVIPPLAPLEDPPLPGKALSTAPSVCAAEVLGKSQTGSEMALLTSTGGLIDGWGTPLGSLGLGWDIARSLARWQEGYQVLDGYGGLHAMAGAAPVESEVEYGFDIARRLVPYNGGYYVLDGLGGVQAGGGCPPLPQAVCFEEDLARAMVLVELEAEMRDPVEAEIERQLPVPPPPGQPGESSQLAYYLLDAYGRVYPVGGLPQRGYAELDRPVAVDLALTPQGDGYYVVDAYGNVFGFGNAPIFEGQTPVFESPRVVRIMAVEQGYYLVDVSGRFYGAGQAAAEPQGGGVGLDVIRDVVLD